MYFYIKEMESDINNIYEIFTLTQKIMLHWVEKSHMAMEEIKQFFRMPKTDSRTEHTNKWTQRH